MDECLLLVSCQISSWSSVSELFMWVPREGAIADYSQAEPLLPFAYSFPSQGKRVHEVIGDELGLGLGVIL